MNIFYLDKNPRKCAEYHCNKHVVKMILETAQLLCGAHHYHGNVAPYKKTHINHPSAIWTRESLDNYKWLVELGKELCREYTYRYSDDGKPPKVHKSQAIIEWCESHLPKIESKGITPIALAMPDEYKSSNAVKSYRSYYIGEKNGILDYKRREKPQWIGKVKQS